MTNQPRKEDTKSLFSWTVMNSTAEAESATHPWGLHVNELKSHIDATNQSMSVMSIACESISSFKEVLGLLGHQPLFLSFAVIVQNGSKGQK